MRILLQKKILTSQKLQIGDFIDERNSFLAFKNNAPFTNCISKINNVLIDNAEDLKSRKSRKWCKHRAGKYKDYEKS